MKTEWHKFYQLVILFNIKACLKLLLNQVSCFVSEYVSLWKEVLYEYIVSLKSFSKGHLTIYHYWSETGPLTSHCFVWVHGCSQLTVIYPGSRGHNDSHRCGQQRDSDPTGVDSGRDEQRSSPSAAWSKGKFTHWVTHALCWLIPGKLHWNSEALAQRFHRTFAASALF